MKDFSTADLCDEHDDLNICHGIFKSYGAKKKFSGKIRTVKAIEDNSFVKKLVEEKVNGDVMVIDGNASQACALLGDNLANIAKENGWSGFVINGCIRDSKIIENIKIGIKALNTMPKKSVKNNVGAFGEKLIFSGVTFEEGHYIYSDEDGIVVTNKEII
tara:strand:- start:867 stop:1346 length:480 start_codon:yes stop_codon:yes gene_type:complete